MSDKRRRIAVLTAAALAYFLSYPEDFDALIARVSTLLKLTNEVSPLLYGLAAVGIIAAAIVKTQAAKQARQEPSAGQAGS